MRYIDIDALEDEIPDAWKQKAREAYEAVKQAAPGKERSDKIDEYSYLWRDLKPILKKHSCGKCWYCESSAHRIIGDVDHRRPKNKLKWYGKHTGPDHAGYWWLAFVWRNYRYACELCNRLNKDYVTGVVGGKGSYFPLLDENQRIYYECDELDLLRERPLLLDPNIAADPLLITFDQDGTAYPASSNAFEKKRAEVSIRLYHLNHESIKERRRLEICRVVFEKVKIGDWHRRQYEQDENNISALQSYRDTVKELRKMISPQAEYSAAARAALKLLRKPERVWVDALLTAS